MCLKNSSVFVLQMSKLLFHFNFETVQIYSYPVQTIKNKTIAGTHVIAPAIVITFSSGRYYSAVSGTISL